MDDGTTYPETRYQLRRLPVPTTTKRQVKDSEKVEPTPSIIKSVLGKSAEDTKQLEGEITKLFDAYHSRFKTKSKPATHIQALSRLNDEELLEKLPEPLERLVERIEEKLQDLPEQ